MDPRLQWIPDIAARFRDDGRDTGFPEPIVQATRGLVHRGSFCYGRAMGSATRLIKKYPNRRLYDTGISSYITLDDVRQLVLNGEAFEVRAAASGQDLTRSVLLQIIAEREDHDEPLLSAALLERFVRLQGNSLQGLLGPWLEQSLDVFMDQQRQLRRELDDMAERNQATWKATRKPAPDTTPDTSGKPA